jgi:uncharacterized protein YjeT (DUF2065 family)
MADYLKKDLRMFGIVKLSAGWFIVYIIGWW